MMKKSVFTYFFLKTLFLFGMACGLFIPARASESPVPVVSLIAHPEKLPCVLQEVATLLHEAVDAANIAVVGQRNISNEYDLKQTRERYSNLCLAKVGRVRALLASLIAYFNPNVMNANSGINGIVAHTASPELSHYVVNIAEHGLQQLDADLDNWAKRIHQRAITEKDISSVTQSATESGVVVQIPSLLSCALFWDEFLYDASPAITELNDLADELNGMRGYCARLTDTYDAFLQHIAKMMGIEPPPAKLSDPSTWLLGIVRGGLRLISAFNNKALTTPITSGFCKKHIREIGVFLEHAKAVQKKIGQLGIHMPPVSYYASSDGSALFHAGQNDLAFSNISYDLSNAIDKIEALRDRLDNALKSKTFIMPISKVQSALEEVVGSLKNCDSRLRKCLPNLFCRGSLTDAQRASLDDVRKQESFIGMGDSALRSIYVETIDVIKAALPGSDIAPELAEQLLKSYQAFESERGRDSLSPPPLPDESTRPRGAHEWVLQGLGFVSAADGITWLATAGLPVAVEYIKKSAGSIHEGVVNLERCRASLSSVLKNVRTHGRWLMPGRSLENIGHRDFVERDVALPGSCADRYRDYLHPAHKKLVEKVPKLENALAAEGKRLHDIQLSYETDGYYSGNVFDYSSYTLCKRLISLCELVGNGQDLKTLESELSTIKPKETITYADTGGGNIYYTSGVCKLLERYVVARKRYIQLHWAREQRRKLMVPESNEWMQFMTSRIPSSDALSVALSVKGQAFLEFYRTKGCEESYAKQMVDRVILPRLSCEMAQNMLAKDRQDYLAKREKLENMPLWKKWPLKLAIYCRLIPDWFALYQINSVFPAHKQALASSKLLREMTYAYNDWTLRHNNGVNAKHLTEISGGLPVVLPNP